MACLSTFSTRYIGAESVIAIRHERVPALYQDSNTLGRTFEASVTIMAGEDRFVTKIASGPVTILIVFADLSRTCLSSGTTLVLMRITLRGMRAALGNLSEGSGQHSALGKMLVH